MGPFFVVFLVAMMTCKAQEYNEKSDAFPILLRNELIKKLEGGGSKAILNPDQKIIGGWSATSGVVPYQAFLTAYTMDSTMEGGGTLITRRHVLTAAHCVKGTLGALVVLGASNKNDIFGLGAKSFLVQGDSFIIHPDYDESTIENDIAIIRLPGFVNPSFTVRPIALPTSQQTTKDFFAGKQGIISGWGKTRDFEWTGSTKLQMAHVNITDLSECQTYYEPRYSVQETQICTRFSGSGTCSGDSGGPLAVEISKKLYLVGITSFGENRCEKVAPSVYTNVPSYLNWINKITQLQ